MNEKLGLYAKEKENAEQYFKECSEVTNEITFDVIAEQQEKRDKCECDIW